jgi:hypothetical protein
MRNSCGLFGLRYNDKAITPGAQTERRGEALAGAGSAWRRIRTGRFTFFYSARSRRWTSKTR